MTRPNHESDSSNSGSSSWGFIRRDDHTAPSLRDSVLRPGLSNSDSCFQIATHISVIRFATTNRPSQFSNGVRASHGVDAAVAYHGSDTEKYLGEVDGLTAPLLMHLAEEDEFISKAAQAEIKAALAKKPIATVYSYAGQSHAFSRHNERTTTQLRLLSRTGGPENVYSNN